MTENDRAASVDTERWRKNRDERGAVPVAQPVIVRGDCQVSARRERCVTLD